MCKCYVGNAVFPLSFTPSPPKLIACNNQWLISVSQSSLLKFWALVLNYKYPNECFFCCFYGFICDFREFPLVKSSKIFTAHCIQHDTNFELRKVGFVKDFFSLFENLSLAVKKNWSYRFSWKTSPINVKYLLPVCPILQNFTKGTQENSESVFCALVDMIKYLTFSFKHINTWALFLGMSAIIKL